MEELNAELNELLQRFIGMPNTSEVRSMMQFAISSFVSNKMITGSFPSELTGRFDIDLEQYGQPVIVFERSSSSGFDEDREWKI